MRLAPNLPLLLNLVRGHSSGRGAGEREALSPLPPAAAAPPGRNGRERVPDASRTIELEETDASRTRPRPSAGSAFIRGRDKAWGSRRRAERGGRGMGGGPDTGTGTSLERSNANHCKEVPGRALTEGGTSDTALAQALRPGRRRRTSQRHRNHREPFREAAVHMAQSMANCSRVIARLFEEIGEMLVLGIRNRKLEPWAAENLKKVPSSLDPKPTLLTGKYAKYGQIALELVIWGPGHGPARLWKDRMPIGPKPCPASHDTRLASAGKTALPVIPGLGDPARPPPPQRRPGQTQRFLPLRREGLPRAVQPVGGGAMPRRRRGGEQRDILIVGKSFSHTPCTLSEQGRLLRGAGPAARRIHPVGAGRVWRGLHTLFLARSGTGVTRAWLRGADMAPWRGHGACMARAWGVHGAGMARAWRGHGACMGRAWRGHGACMGRAWHVSLRRAGCGRRRLPLLPRNPFGACGRRRRPPPPHTHVRGGTGSTVLKHRSPVFAKVVLGSTTTDDGRPAHARFRVWGTYPSWCKPHGNTI
eukprot:gene3829-biopygen5298